MEEDDDEDSDDEVTTTEIFAFPVASGPGHGTAAELRPLPRHNLLFYRLISP